MRLAALGELFNAKLSEASQVLYFEALKDLELFDVTEAMGKAARFCKFMPRPVEIREFACGTVDEDAVNAWNGWKQAARMGGAGRSLICDDVTAKTISTTFGSWVEACLVELSPEMWANKRKEFIANFKIYRERKSTTDVGYKLLRGSYSHDGKPMYIDDDGSVMWISYENARQLLAGSDDEHEFNRRLSN